MNHYFRLRTPEPKTNALRIVVGSMICTLVAVLVGIGMWMGLDSIQRPPAVNQPVEQRQAEPSTNQDVAEERYPSS